VAGSLERQIKSAIRRNDIVLLVLSETALTRDWVWAEIKATREREHEEGRDILCPIAVDDSWTRHDQHMREMSYLTERKILDFSKSRTFEREYGKLVHGFRTQYGNCRAVDADASDKNSTAPI
jgi:hypothetical protein